MLGSGVGVDVEVGSGVAVSVGADGVLVNVGVGVAGSLLSLSTIFTSSTAASTRLAETSSPAKKKRDIVSPAKSEISTFRLKNTK